MIKRTYTINISAHDLLIERGRYFRQRIPREQRICVQCNQVEDKEHFSYFVENIHICELHCLIIKLNLKIPVPKTNTNKCFKLFYELMNPSSAADTKLICKGLGSRMTKICPIQYIDQNASKYKSAWDIFKNNNNKFENQSLWLLL